MTSRLKITAKETSPLPRATRRTNGTTGTKTWTSLGTLYARTNTESMMRGVDTPNFYKRKARGDLLPHTAFMQYFAETERNSYSNTWTFKNAGVYDTYDVVEGSGSNTIQDQYEVNEFDSSTGLALLAGIDAGSYLQDAAKAINGKGFDSLTFLAELAKVRRMFKNVIYRVLKLVRNPRDIDHIASLWLEGRYGWRTLRYDLIDLSEALTEFDTKRSRYTETRGTTFTKHYPTAVEASTSAGIYTTYGQLDLEIGIRGCITADINPARFRANVITTGWELIPFSFVIDWLVSIGSMLESVVFLTSVVNYSASTGTQVQARRVETVGNLVKAASTGTWSFSREEVETGTWTYRNPMSVSINPTVKVKLDEWKVLDLLALIRQTFYSKGKR